MILGGLQRARSQEQCAQALHQRRDLKELSLGSGGFSVADFDFGIRARRSSRYDVTNDAIVRASAIAC